MNNHLTRVLALNINRCVGRSIMSLCAHSHFQSYSLPGPLQKNLLTFNWVRLASKSNVPLTCWKCSKIYEKLTPLFCESCQVILKPNSSQNYFDLLSFEPNFDVDVDNLSRKYKDKQKLLHPDKFTLKSQDEQDIAAEFSSLINKAYGTLRNPWLRGTYLLKLQGISLDETTKVDDPTFLFRIMEINEEIADAVSVEQLKKLQKENSVELECVIRELSVAFRGNDLETAKKYVITLRYLTNISEKISEKLYSLGERL